MKKIISYVLFAIFTLFFGISLINDLSYISTIINAANQNESWIIISVFILDIICCISLLIYAILALKKVNRFNDEQNFKSALLLMAIYQGFGLISSVIAIFSASELTSSIIVSLLLLLVSFILFLCSLLNKNLNLKAKKVLSLIAYLITFIIVVRNSSSTLNVILFFAIIFGVIQTILVNVELNTLLNNLFKSEDEASLRLKKLNELYEEKLISEEEYNSKRKEIVDSL
ncbi:unknown [Firmicutes bacterium CAG:449]|nr:unknown [Firmicutes bacterium CAG:449]